MSEDATHNSSKGIDTQPPESADKQSGRGRISALADETKGLVSDMKEWVDLRVRLVQLELEERIEKVANQVISLLVIIVLGLFTALFLLLGLAVWVGSLVDSPALGYVIVGGILGLITLIIQVVGPRFMKTSSAPDRPSLTEHPESKKLLKKASSTTEPMPQDIDRGKTDNAEELS